MDLISGFLRQCANTPERIALSENDQHISYAEFNRRRQHIAAHLRQRACAGSCIALFLERGSIAATAIYAILSANACYLPLDIKNPSDRINFIIHDARPKYILGHGPCPKWLETPEKWLDLGQLPDDLIFTPCAIDPQAIAAILYTSGSTGTPKGVALSHQAMLNFAEWARTAFTLTADDRIASLAPFHFDLSVFDLFSSLAGGASVYFMPAQLSQTPARLTQWLQAQAITCWYTVPSLLSFLALKGGLANTPLTALRTLLFAGEVFPTPHLIKLAGQLPQVRLYNLYGPTETNVCCYWPVDPNRLQAEQAIPIGIPACNAQLKIKADSGELLVNSLNNFAGFWQQGELHPIASDNWYATGDKVSLNERGEYCYHGRLDRMLKCSGYRVEPAEVENIIRQSPAVSRCAVIGIRDSSGGQRPAAAIVLNEPYTLAELIPALKPKLPHYMQPVKFLVLQAMPVLSNGKTDYSTLQSLIENA